MPNIELAEKNILLRLDMGFARLKKLISEDLYRTFTVQEMQLIINDSTEQINLHDLTGYPVNQIIPKKEAAEQIVDYLHKKGKLPVFVGQYMDIVQKGFRGEKPSFHNLNQIKKELEECGYKYSDTLKKVISTDVDNNGWGYLEEGKVYNFCFVSVDICSNSNLIVSYPPDTVRDTYTMFRKTVTNFAKKRDGIIWNWEGDGGIAVFHLGDTVNQAALFAIDLLEYMPIFNATINYIDGEDIKIRAGIHAGTAEYKKDTGKINSDSIEKVKYVEKKMTLPMTVSITQSTFSNINRVLRDYFENVEVEGETVFRYNFSLKG